MDEVTIKDETILYRRLFPAQANDGPKGPKTVVNSHAFKVSKKIEQEISVEIAGVMTRKGIMTAHVCAFWKDKPVCGAGFFRADEVRALGFKVTHTVLPGESEAHALLEAANGEVTPLMVRDLASITKVEIRPDEKRQTIPAP